MDARQGADGRIRCAWAYAGPAMIAYHDQEWGVPVMDDRELFAKLILDTFQAGLSWRVVLEKRDAFLELFDGFDPVLVARYDEAKVAALMAEPRIIRNQAKIRATITNAQAFLDLQQAEGSFRPWLMQFVDHQPIIDGSCPALTPESRAMAQALKARGFRFAGPTVCYAFMQATGFVMDHVATCFRTPVCTAMLRPSQP